MTYLHAVRATVTALAVPMLLMGCQTGPDYTRPDTTLPDAWHTERAGGESEGPALHAWWESFDDPALNTLVQRATESNYDLRIAEARVREARAARGIAASALWPTLDASASWTRTQSVDTGGSGSSRSGGLTVGPGGITRSFSARDGDLSVSRSAGPNGTSTGVTLNDSSAPGRTTSLYKAGFDARWELDLFGGNRRAVEAADATVDAAVEFRRDVLVSLLAEVALNYIELRTAQNRLAITQNNIDAQDETSKLTRERFDAGLSSELDAVRADALLASTQSQVPLLQTQVAAATHRLSVLLGESPGALFAELNELAPLPAPPTEVPVGLPSDLLRRRADIRQQERELAAATARIGVATAELFPKFSLTGSLAGQGASLGDVFSGGGTLWSLGPGVSWPLFDGGRIRANINVENARQEQALLAYEQSILFALEDVETSLVAYAQEQIRLDAIGRAVDANATAVQLANERYRRGLEGFLNVLQAQQELFRTEDQQVQSESFVLTNLIALYKALGGGWEEWETAEPTMAHSVE